MESEVLTTEQVAQLFKCNPVSITRMVRRGHLPAFKLPGSSKLRFYAEELKPFLQSKTWKSDE